MFIDHKTRREEKFYKNWPEDREPVSLWDSVGLSKYNRKLWEKLLAQKIARETKIQAIMKKYNNSLEWWPCSRSDLPKASAAEQLIIDALNLWDVVWYREVEFKALMSSDYSYHRYDILLELPNNIQIIEYDGQFSHSTPEQIEKDRIKTEFCRVNNIPITRWNKAHYYHLSKCVEDLMIEHGIKRK